MSVTFTYRPLAAALELVAKEELTLTHVRWMFALDSNRDRSMSEISDALGFTQAASTGIQDRLEEKGMVTKVRASGDRRRFHPVLTAKGEALLNRLSAVVERGLPC